MKNRYVSIALLFAILSAVVIVAGCATSSPSAPSATSTPGGVSPTIAPAATGQTSGGVLGTLASAFDKSKVHWYEYQMTTSGGSSTGSTSKMRMDYGVDYNGVKADKVSINAETKAGDTTMNTIITIYSSGGKTLGGEMQTLQNGQVLFSSTIQPSQGGASTGSSSGSNPFATYSGASLTSAGTEPVTVPGYTGVATKYNLADTSGSTGSVWVASGVPVPVKYQGGSGGQTVTLELTGWG